MLSGKLDSLFQRLQVKTPEIPTEQKLEDVNGELISVQGFTYTLSKVGQIISLNLIEDGGLKIFFKSLPNNKILVLPKLKAFAEEKIIVTKKLKLDL